MKTIAEREYHRLLLSPPQLRDLINEAVRLFPGPTAVSTTIEASFGDKSGTFNSLDELLAEPHLPATLYDFQLRLYLTSYDAKGPTYLPDVKTKLIYLRRLYPNVSLHVDAEDDPIWAYGVAEVLGRRLKAIAESPVASSRGTAAKAILWLDRVAARARPYFFGGLAGLLLGSLCFGGWRPMLAIAALLLIVAWIFLLCALLWFLIPKPINWRSEPAILALIVRGDTEAESQSSVAAQTLQWTKANVLVAIAVAVLLIVATFFAAYYGASLVRH